MYVIPLEQRYHQSNLEKLTSTKQVQPLMYTVFIQNA